MNRATHVSKFLRIFALLALLLAPGLPAPSVTASSATASSATAIADSPHLRMVKDINPNQSVTAPNAKVPTAFGDLLFFAYDDGIHGYEPWISDGTASGTLLLADIVAGAGDGLAVSGWGFYFPIVASQILYFEGLDGEGSAQTWKTDGTPAGTVPSDIPYGLMAAVGNEVFYFSSDSALEGPSLYRTEGSQATSVKVKTWDSSYSIGGELIAWNGEVYFFHNVSDTPGSSTISVELWKSDGTETGTILLFSFHSVAYTPGWIVLTNNLAFFAPYSTEYGIELWQTNGTPGGTQLVEDENPVGNLFVTSPAVFGDTLFFMGNTQDGNMGLYKTKGVSTGVEKIISIFADSLTNVDGTLFFREEDNSEGRIWKSDGTPAGTVEVCPACSYNVVEGLTSFLGKLYFFASDDAHGTELWVSDGTAAGTYIVQDTNPGPASANPVGLAKVGEKLFFAANDGSHGHELWVYEIISVTEYSVYLPLVQRIP